jgi:hypothetical protein
MSPTTTYTYFRERIPWSPTKRFGRLSVGSRWYTSDFYEFTSDIETFIQSWHQGFYSMLKEKNFKCLQPKSVSLRHLDVCKIACQSGVSQWVLRNGNYGTTYSHRSCDWLRSYSWKLQITFFTNSTSRQVVSIFVEPLKKHLAGNQFATDADVKKAVIFGYRHRFLFNRYTSVGGTSGQMPK